MERAGCRGRRPWHALGPVQGRCSWPGFATAVTAGSYSSLIIVNGSTKSAPQFAQAMSHGSPALGQAGDTGRRLASAVMWIVIPIAARSVWMIRAWSVSCGAPVGMYKVACACTPAASGARLGQVGSAEWVDVDRPRPGDPRNEVLIGRSPAVEQEMVLHKRPAVDRVVDGASHPCGSEHPASRVEHESRFPAAFRPPAFASRSSDSRRGIRPSSRLAYRARPSARTSTGLPRSARTSCDPGWVPPITRGRWCSPGRVASPTGTRRFPAASP